MKSIYETKKELGALLPSVLRPQGGAFKGSCEKDLTMDKRGCLIPNPQLPPGRARHVWRDTSASSAAFRIASFVEP